jgi:hypothetical protein
MINPALASITINSCNYVRFFEATTIRKRYGKRCCVVPLTLVNKMFYGHEGLQEPECAS